MTAIRRRFLACAAAGALLAVTGGLSARSGFAAPPRPNILGVRADLVQDTVTIVGSGFGMEPPPVLLGGVPLTIDFADEDTIVAHLPGGAAGGNHRLVVGSGNRSDSADIWIPGEGIVTRSGIRIESTESDVMIVAGASRVVVSPTGGIRIESAGPLAIDSQGALTLRGTSVRVDSATSLRLLAGTSFEAVASGTARLSAAGATTVSGAVVNLN
jgi:IPT/TIG domain-containing protein